MLWHVNQLAGGDRALCSIESAENPSAATAPSLRVQLVSYPRASSHTRDDYCFRQAHNLQIAGSSLSAISNTEPQQIACSLVRLLWHEYPVTISTVNDVKMAKRAGAALMEDEDIRIGSVLNKIKNCFLSISATTWYVWRRRRILLSNTEPLLREFELKILQTPPLRYFLLVSSFAAVCESSLFSAKVSPELPSWLGIFGGTAKFIPEITIYFSLISVFVSALLPWLAYKVTSNKVPFRTIMRAYAYQQGGIVLPFALIIILVTFTSTRNGGWQPWFNYAYLLIVPASLFASYWVSLQLKDEGYSPQPMRLAAFVTALSLGAASEQGLKLSKSYRAVGVSMAPTISPRDILLVNNHVFRWRDPERGELVMISRPDQPPVIMRIMALPGDVIQIQGGQVVINGERLSLVDVSKSHGQKLKELCSTGSLYENCGFRQYRETLENGQSYFIIDQASDSPLDHTQEYKVPDATYFVLGDNRDVAADSRISSEEGGLGFVARANILGAVYDRVAPSNSGKLDDIRHRE